jgi:hypothetical protein
MTGRQDDRKEYDRTKDRQMTVDEYMINDVDIFIVTGLADLPIDDSRISPEMLIDSGPRQGPHPDEDASLPFAGWQAKAGGWTSVRRPGNGLGLEVRPLGG